MKIKTKFLIIISSLINEILKISLNKLIIFYYHISYIIYFQIIHIFYLQKKNILNFILFFIKPFRVNYSLHSKIFNNNYRVYKIIII